MSNSVRAMNKSLGASADAETGSRPTGQAELHRLDASRFDPARLAEFAERCEKATESDRELDAMIAVAVDFVACDSNPPSARALHSDYGGSNSFADIGKYWPRLPRYTASLDAAMTLVPEGWHLMKMCEGPNEEPRSRNFAYDGTGSVILHFVGTPRKLYNLKYGNGATFALALCAAALRARAASADTHPKDGDSTQIEAPLVSGAVPLAADVQTTPPSSNEGKLS